MSEENRSRLRAIVEEFRTGVLVTRSTEGTLRGRPMAIAKFEANDDLFFATSVESGKVAEIDEHHEAAVTFQSKTAYVSLGGPAKAVTDRKLIEKYWSEEMRVWFPEGPTDPSLCLIQLRPVQGEFWSMEGLKGLRYVFDAARAYVTGTTPHTFPDQHGQIGDAEAAPTHAGH